MTVQANIVAGGFSDPVFETQQIFRALMDGMARPGRIQCIDLPIRPPSPLSTAAGGILLTLCDHDTPVWLSAALAKSSLPSWLGFHTGTSLAQEKAEARFAVIELGNTIASFGLFSQGTQDYPDRSATLLIEVPDLNSGPAMQLTGPGILDTEVIRPGGLPALFERLWTENRAAFPRGVDVIFTCGNRFCCLPRSTRLTVTEA